MSPGHGLDRAGSCGTEWRVLAAICCAAALLLGCAEDEPPSRQRGMGFDVPPRAGPPKGEAKTTSEAGDAPRRHSEPVVYQDEDFVESDRNRDPFRTYTSSTERGQVRLESQRRVVMPTTAIESMRLIAIVSGTPKPRAMILDPLEVGHVVERGMYIGRAQVVQAVGNVPMMLNWRVDRIRENEVVLTRQDPTDPSRPPLSRVMPLHDEET